MVWPKTRRKNEIKRCGCNHIMNQNYATKKILFVSAIRIQLVSLLPLKLVGRAERTLAVIAACVLWAIIFWMLTMETQCSPTSKQFQRIFQADCVATAAASSSSVGAWNARCTYKTCVNRTKAEETNTIFRRNLNRNRRAEWTCFGNRFSFGVISFFSFFFRLKSSEAAHQNQV